MKNLMTRLDAIAANFGAACVFTAIAACLNGAATPAKVDTLRIEPADFKPAYNLNFGEISCQFTKNGSINFYTGHFNEYGRCNGCKFDTEFFLEVLRDAGLNLEQSIYLLSSAIFFGTADANFIFPFMGTDIQTYSTEHLTHVKNRLREYAAKYRWKSYEERRADFYKDNNQRFAIKPENCISVNGRILHVYDYGMSDRVKVVNGVICVTTRQKTFDDFVQYHLPEIVKEFITPENPTPPSDDTPAPEIPSTPSTPEHEMTPADDTPVDNAPAPAVAYYDWRGVKENIGDENYAAFQTTLDNAANKLAALIWRHYEKEITIADRCSSSNYFQTTDDADFGVHIDAESDCAGDDLQAPFESLVHEGAHNIDLIIARDELPFNPGFFSAAFKEGALAKAAKSDLDAAYKAFAPAAGDTRRKFIAPLIEQAVESTGTLREHGATSDIFSLISNGKIHCGAGHSQSYGRGLKQIYQGLEIFADFFEAAITNHEGYKNLQTFFPRTARVFHEMLMDRARKFIPNVDADYAYSDPCYKLPVPAYDTLTATPAAKSARCA